MINKILTLAMCFLFLSIAAQAQGLPSAPPNQTDVKAAQKLTAKDYDDLLAKLKKGDTAVDFAKLRFAYTETKDYSPYGIGADEKNALFDDLNGKKYEDALKKAEEILKTNYVEMNAHYVAFVSNRELGKPEKSEFHKKVFTRSDQFNFRRRGWKNGEDSLQSYLCSRRICRPEFSRSSPDKSGFD